MSRKFLLDTNTISLATSRRSKAVLQRMTELEPAMLCISAISYAEIWFGLKRRPDATRLRTATIDLLAEIEILPWTAEVGDVYADVRAEMQRLGLSLGALDMLIAAHAVESGAVLVTSDRAFRHVPGLNVEDWVGA